MSQYGMHMPAGQSQRGPTMNVYTGLLFAAVMALLAASVYVYVQGKEIGPRHDPLSIHKAKVSGTGYEIDLGND
jgi:hypothetical protein